jgi:hypothetical protein
MVSTDHFRQELLSQLGRAAGIGRIDLLINSGELCRSLPTGRAWSVSCCDAMEAEMKPGDVLLIERANGVGMTVRYLLPRPTGAASPQLLAQRDRPLSARHHSV